MEKSDPLIRIESTQNLNKPCTNPSVCYNLGVTVSGVNIFPSVQDANINVNCDFTRPNRGLSRFRSTGMVYFIILVIGCRLIEKLGLLRELPLFGDAPAKLLMRLDTFHLLSSAAV